MERAELNQQNLQAYRQRWTAVAAVEVAERQSTSILERWQQLNALYRVAMSLNILPQEQNPGLHEGQQRWQALYEQAKTNE